MKVILYKKCIVNENYDEVFRTKQLLEEHLALLNQHIIQIDDTYTVLEGSISFEITANWLDLYEYNYMKFIDNENNNTVNYAFINNVNVVNGLCVVNYTCDIWHTFYGNWNLRESLLTHSLFPSSYNADEVILPTQYKTNKPPIIVSFSTPENVGKYKILVEVQMYKKTQEDKISDRQVFYGILKEKFKHEPLTELRYSWFNDLEKLIIKQSLGENVYFHTPLIDNDFDSYDIVNAWVVPFEFNFNEHLPDEYNTYFRLQEEIGDTIYQIYLCDIPFTQELQTITLPASYKILNVGFPTNMTQVVNNGKQHNIKVIKTFNKYEPEIHLQIDGIDNNITSLFQIDMPFGSISSSDYAQRKTAHNMKVFNSSMKIVNGVVDLGVDIATFGGSLTARNTVKGIKRINRNKEGQISSRSYKETRQTSSGVSDLADDMGGIAGGIAGLIASTRPNYVSNTPNVTENSAFYNAYYGLSMFYIDSYNDNEVDNILKETGYEINVIVNNILTSLPNTTNLKYDVIKFDFIRVNGCSTEINDTIKSILLNGVKVWYKRC